MKKPTKKPGSSPAAPRPKMGRPARYPARRINIAARLQLPLYQQVVAAAEQNGRSISEEVERRLELSLDHDRVFGSAEIRDIAIRIATRFDDGGRLASDRPASEWMRDPHAYGNAMLSVLEGLLARYPAPNFDDLMALIEALKGRVAFAVLRQPTPTKEEK